MPFVSSRFFSRTPKGASTHKDKTLLARIFQASETIRGFRVRMRYGHLTRASLRLLRFEMQEDAVDCEWLARLPDVWDADLPLRIQYRHASLQALRDAIDIRAMLFDLMPHIGSAHLRVYREANDSRELVINGLVDRSDRLGRGVHSLAMRAKTLGFHFDLDGDYLRPIAEGGTTPPEYRRSEEWGLVRIGNATNRNKGTATGAVRS